ncbi:NUDIX domain-containing protein [Clostridium sp. E02]|uniref:NUDIX domain-containing protein n=1 Tax=Clostridium sp. E02 TaxID=2487134 RepID=UPI000F524ECE|nr:NUDIX domain-containing protein [Clostridium sp. E02]
MVCKTFNVGELKKYKYVVVLSKYNGKILLSKHKERDTWENQGGHIEEGESPLEAAKRELYEESGALQYTIAPFCDYWAGEADLIHGDGGVVFTAEIFKLGNIPESEMQEVKTFEQLPDKLTYKALIPALLSELEHIDQSFITKNELVIDVHNYIEGGSVFKRTAVRGIIQKNGKYLLIYSKYGDHKFPGGGMNAGETFEQTLVREVQEETGYVVDVSSIMEGPVVFEKRKGHPDDLMIMDSHYFYCDVSEAAGNRNLDDYEEEYDYQVRWMTLGEAIERNESVENYDNIPWVERETLVMKRLAEFI